MFVQNTPKVFTITGTIVHTWSNSLFYKHHLSLVQVSSIQDMWNHHGWVL